MATLTVAAPPARAHERPQQALPDDRCGWQCPHCAAAVELSQDRVRDCIMRHPKIIVRETQYWRCPVCHAVAYREISEHAEHIAYIASGG